ncbi:MAG: GMC family oxidoreductase [Alphaproteobacteria bacterium]
MDRGYDYVIVGGGTAGCVLAARLSADPGARVLVLEAGGGDRHPVFRIPMMTGTLLRNRYANWFYQTEPVPGMEGRRLFWPRGKVIGGSSSINGMVYVRGLPMDFDSWAQAGLPAWSWDRVRPLFLRSEGHDGGASEDHGGDGPLRTSRPPPFSPLSDVFVAAGREAGYPATPDFNAVPEGFGRYDFNISGGQRWSTARAFLDPARGRPNHAVVTRAHVLRIVFSGDRAVAVEASVRGRVRRFAVDGEVLLCGGTVNSPQLLMLSGVGGADALRRLGIPVVADLPGVGRNLQDHVLVRVEHACTQPVTLHGLTRIDRAGLAFLQALLFRSGPMTRFPLESGAYLRSDPALDAPDIQSHFLPGLSTATLRLPGLRAPPRRHDGHAFFANAYQMRPESRGEIALASADPFAAPAIRPNCLSAQKDRLVLRRAIEILRDVFAQSSFDPWRGRELAPGPEVRTAAEIDAWIRRNADTVYHPVGTCRMGRGEDAVVDEALRVRGLRGVRVVDASIMPSITSTNTHATVIMIAEQAAAFLRGEATARAG